MAANNVTVRLSAEEAGMVRAWMEARRGVQEFSQELDRAGQKGGTAGKKIQDGFGSGLSQQLLGTVTSLVSVGAAVGAVTAKWTEWIQAQEKAAASMKRVLDI